MHLLHISCTRKTVLGFEVKVHLDVHQVYVATLTNAS